jgi:mTERF
MKRIRKGSYYMVGATLMGMAAGVTSLQSQPQHVSRSPPMNSRGRPAFSTAESCCGNVKKFDFVKRRGRSRLWEYSYSTILLAKSAGNGEISLPPIISNATSEGTIQQVTNEKESPRVAKESVQNNIYNLSVISAYVEDYSLDGLFDEEDDVDFLDDLFLEEDGTFDDGDDEEDRSVILTDGLIGLGPLSPPAIPLDNISPNLSYFYLRDELGLSEDIMWKITYEAPSLLGFRAETIRNKVRVLKSLMGLSDEELRQVVSVQPAILRLSAKKNISPTILYLQRQLDLSRKELRQLLLGNPCLLNYSLKNLHSKIVFFFQQTMGYTKPEVRKILLKDPWLLACSVHNGLLPRLEFLHKEIKISSSDLRAIISKNPTILRMSVEQNLQPKLIFFFILTLRMTTRDVAKMLLKFPHILNYHLERHFQPIYQYLVELELLSSYEFANILRRFPKFVTFSLPRIKQRIGYLRYQLCFDASSIRRILHQSPQVMSLSQDNLETTIQFLLEAVVPNATLQYYHEEDDEVDLEVAFDNRYMEDDNGEQVEWNGKDDRYSLNIVHTLILGMPSLLHLNITTSLQPKVEYLQSVLGQDELSRVLLTFPPLLGYSLENRIKPRMQKLLDAGIEGGKIAVCLPFKEEDFEAWLVRRKESVRRERNKQAEQDVEIEKIIVNDGSSETGTEELSFGLAMGNREIKDGGRIMHWRRRS